MSKELEEQLARVPAQWQEVTRTRAHAVMDYLAAGDDGTLLLNVLCKRARVSRSMFYHLVRRWKAASGDAAALAPWAKRPGTPPRIEPEATRIMDEMIAARLEAKPDSPIEPIARGVLADWPEDIETPGISYARRRVVHARAEREKKTSPPGLVVNVGAYPAEAAGEPRWPLDVVVVDHAAIEALVRLDDGMATLPIATVAFDLMTGLPLAAVIGLDGPSPPPVVATIRTAAATALELGAPAGPAVLLATTFAKGWPQLTDTLLSTGARVIARRTRLLHFGGPLSRVLGGRVAGYRVAPRLGHRPAKERATAKALAALPSRDLETLAAELEAWCAAGRAGVADAAATGGAATSDLDVWRRLAGLAPASAG